jgi:flagellar basal-body rod modification protein FlgD
MSTSNNILTAAQLGALNGTAKSGTGTTPTSGTGVAGNANQLDYLNLMMEQLKNQDPTKPMDSAAISSQLAQLGTVNGITQLNNSFNSLSGQLVSNQALQASSLLGRNVLVNGSSAPLSAGGSIAGAVSVPSAAKNVTLQVVDAAGTVVRTLPLGDAGAGNLPFSWNGVTDAGATAAPGTYRIAATASVGGTGAQLGTLVQGQVASITLNGATAGGLLLHVNGVGDVPLGAVQQIN